MTDPDGRLGPTPSRRALLGAGLGTLATVGGAAGLARARMVSFDGRRRVPAARVDDAHGADLRVAWAEWVESGGRVTTGASAGAADDRSTGGDRESGTRTGPEQGPVTLAGVTPGDAGGVTFGLDVVAREGDVTPPPVALGLRLRVPPGSRREHGRTEPERASGDDTGRVGELHEYLDVALWYDTGVRAAGVPLLGVRDADRGVGDVPLASGSLADLSVSGTDGPWRRLDAAPGDPTDDGRCLGPRETLFVSLAWSLPLTDREAGGDLDVVQGDAVAFDVEFRAEGCRK